MTDTTSRSTDFKSQNVCFLLFTYIRFCTDSLVFSHDFFESVPASLGRFGRVGTLLAHWVNPLAKRQVKGTQGDNALVGEMEAAEAP